jgi:hypothetical protein
MVRRRQSPDVGRNSVRVFRQTDIVIGIRMDYNQEKLDEAVLLTLHDSVRAWKSFDWDVLNRLHEKGYISNPVGKAKSVVLTENGLNESKRLFNELFRKP